LVYPVAVEATGSRFEPEAAERPETREDAVGEA
jgi:hypothetical protein